AWQCQLQECAVALEPNDTAANNTATFLHSSPSCFIQSIPKLFDIGMRLVPATDECLDFILRTIRLKFAPSARSAGITKSEIGSFADAALRVVLCESAVGFVEYLTGSDAIRFIPGIVGSIEASIRIEFPFFAGNPR